MSAAKNRSISLSLYEGQLQRFFVALRMTLGTVGKSVRA
jgi:hypothetical protein